MNLIHLTGTREISISQDDPNTYPNHMDRPHKITFSPITSKCMDTFTPNLINSRDNISCPFFI